MEVCYAALRMEYQKRGNQIDFIGIILIFFEACTEFDSVCTKSKDEKLFSFHYRIQTASFPNQVEDLLWIHKIS
jgi:hypothetical protein